MNEKAIEAAAKAIDPLAFKLWQAQYDYCKRDGDGEEYAKRCADNYHLADMEAARAKARAAARIFIEACAKWVDERRDDYVSEHGSYDSSIGVTEFPGNGDEYVYELEEIAEGIRALAPVKEG